MSHHVNTVVPGSAGAVSSVAVAASPRAALPLPLILLLLLHLPLVLLLLLMPLLVLLLSLMLIQLLVLQQLLELLILLVLLLLPEPGRSGRTEYLKVRQSTSGAPHTASPCGGTAAATTATGVTRRFRGHAAPSYGRLPSPQCCQRGSFPPSGPRSLFPVSNKRLRAPVRRSR